ncbi:MAG TPA: WYL domain-containing protein, partial [Clostridiales bacterium]|nr:WYL domain-containing protein [Clostridiales bacterium]
VTAGAVCDTFDDLRHTLDAMQKHMWGVSTQSFSGKRMEHVEFTVRYADDEPHILRRLEREKRVGTVERLDKNTARFTADIFDATEMIPWIRTFLCRITTISFSNKALEAQFKDDLRRMYALYGMEGGETE